MMVANFSTILIIDNQLKKLIDVMIPFQNAANKSKSALGDEVEVCLTK
jgi:hypothetical protein